MRAPHGSHSVAVAAAAPSPIFNCKSNLSMTDLLEDGNPGCVPGFLLIMLAKFGNPREFCQRMKMSGPTELGRRHFPWPIIYLNDAEVVLHGDGETVR